MRRSLIVSCLVTVLAVFGLIGIGFCVAAQDEEVYLTETVLVGDKTYAEDISFQINSHWNEKMLWETKVEIGEEMVTKTDFSFYPDGFSYEIPSQSSARLQYYMNFGYGSSSDLLNQNSGQNRRDVPFYDVFVDVASRTQSGQERTETVNLSKYYEYFDMEIYYNSKKYLSRYTYGKYTEDENAYMNKVLALRIPEELEFEATVEKSEDGKVYNLHGNAGTKIFEIISDGMVLKDGIYIYVYAMDEDGLVPGVSETGYGIYKLPITWGALERTENTTAIIMLEEFALVYPLEEKILAMKADEAEEEIFLLLERDKRLFLQRIEKKTMTLLQEFALGIAEDNWLACHDMQITEEGVMLIMNDKRIYFAQKLGADYQLTIEYQMPDEEAFHSGAWDTYAYAYEDGRLAIIWGGSKEHYYQCSSSVYVFVLEGEELKFLAHYANSLDHVDTFWDYGNKLHPGQAYEIWMEE